ncbi:MAG: glycosyltransferase, partial [Cyanobacteria bacterium J06635_1]
MPKPSISLFIPNLDGGGAERVMLHLAEGFAERGLQVDLVVARAQGAYLSKIPNSVRLVNLDARSPLLLFKTLALKQYLQHEQPAFLI